VVAIARAADNWLAAYAEVDATLRLPLDPIATGQTVAALLRGERLGLGSTDEPARPGAGPALPA
ncbi:MAG TPA: hypothetical protein VFY17_06395, partial [Pilimelia sp.]|nr:hypothetical protein [Pilimelia sp.]